MSLDDAACAAGSSDSEGVEIGDVRWQRLERGGPGQARVRPVAVVVELVNVQDLAEMFVVPDQGAVQEFPADRADPELHDRVYARGPHAAQHGADAGIGQDSVEGGKKVGAAVANQELHRSCDAAEVHDHVSGHLRGPLAGRMEHAARLWIRRVACSMTTRTWTFVPSRRSAVKKSQAMMPSAWDRRKLAQVTGLRRGATSTLAFLRISQTVEAAMVTPSPASSPWIRP